MKVPYSMDESEPDLHCGMGGCQFEYDEQDLVSSHGGRDGGYGDPVSHANRPAMFTFISEEELVASEVFQKHLRLALASSQRTIDALRQEILDAL